MAFKELLKKQRQTGSNLFSSVGTAAVGTTLEKIDPRNYLFKSGSIMNALFPKVKGYSATEPKEKIKTSQLVAPSLDISSLNQRLDIVAKNTSVMPLIMRDTNIMRQGIVKLVKLSGGTQRDKADRFFQTAKERESLYESQFKTVSPTTSPTKVSTTTGEKEGGGFLSYLFKGLMYGGLVAGIGKLLENEDVRNAVKGFMVKVVGVFFDGISSSIKFVGELLQDPNVRESIGNTISNFFKTIGEFFSIQLTSLETPFGSIKVTLGGAIATVVGALAAFNAAVVAATVSLTRAAVGGAGGAAAAGAGSKLLKKSLPFVLMGGALYYLNKDTNQYEPAAPGTVAPPGTPDVTGTPDAMGAPDINQITQKREISGTDKAIAAVAGGVATQQAISGASKIPGLAKQTGTAILDARTQSVGQLAQSTQDSRWGKFLKFVAQKSPKLWGKIAVKLASAGTLATVPIVGWVAAAVQLGFSVWTAWELYSLWKEFSSISDEQQIDVNVSPSPTPAAPQNVAPAAGPTPVTSATSGVSLEQIGQAESGRMGYDAANRGKAGDMPNGLPGLSTKTVGEVMRMQANKELFAAGKYQIIPATLKGLVNQGVAKETDIFNKETQDKLAQSLYNTAIAKAGDDPVKQQFELSKVWAAITNPYTGASYYAGVGNNKASIGTTVAQMPPASGKVPGTAIAGSSIQLSDLMRVATAAAPVVINAPTTNMQSAPQTPMNMGGIPSVVDEEFMRILVSRVTG